MNTQLAKRTTALTKLTSQLDYFLVDGSGSMQSNWWDFLASIDAYVAGVKAANIDSHIIMQVFDTFDLDLVQRDLHIRDWKTMSEDPIGANWGGTPLYDAITVMCNKLKVLDPERASIVVVTDGDDNGDRFTDEVQARRFLDWIKFKGWQLTFIGCDFNNSRIAQRLGISDQHSIGVAKALLSDAAKNLAEKRSNYGKFGTPMHFTDEEKKSFGGYLNAPEAK